MTTAIAELIRDMAAVIVEEVHPRAIVLFGSHALGTASPDSDVDLLVVDAGSFNARFSRRQEMTRLWRALAIFPVSKDILVYTLQEIDLWRDARNRVVGRALREGKLLYGSL